MSALEWGGVLHYGTQNASRVGLFAAKASILELTRDENAGFKHIWRLGEKLRDGLSEVFRESNTKAIVQSVGPMLHILFTKKDRIRDYREFCAHVDRKKYQKFALALFDHGIYMTPSACLHTVVTLPHSEGDVTYTIDACRRVLEKI
jgi:glutamate-1-semialdehyde 2,1-aminomutase